MRFHKTPRVILNSPGADIRPAEGHLPQKEPYRMPHKATGYIRLLSVSCFLLTDTIFGENFVFPCSGMINYEKHSVGPTPKICVLSTIKHSRLTLYWVLNLLPLTLYWVLNLLPLTLYWVLNLLSHTMQLKHTPRHSKTVPNVWNCNDAVNKNLTKTVINLFCTSNIRCIRNVSSCTSINYGSLNCYTYCLYRWHQLQIIP